jgi:hypothetical protein
MKRRTLSDRRAGVGAALVVVALALVAALAASAGSGQAAPARKAAAPVNDVAPSITGTAREGETLSGNPGKWRGTAPMTFTGRWRRCNANGASCSTISGTTNQLTYRLRSQDVGHTIRVLVTAENRDGKTNAQSGPTPVVTGAPASAPSVVSPPVITGNPQEGNTLSGTAGEWRGVTPITYSYQWQRCDNRGANCANISGATRTTYTLSSADVNNVIRLRVIARNRVGQTAAFSNLSNPIAPPLPAGAVRLPDGKISIPATSVSLPERLVINELAFTPNPLRNRNDTITARFRIYDTRNYVVRDALVFVTPLPYGWTSQPAETITGQDGWATVTMRATKSLPRKAAIVMFVRARKSGEFLLAGVSNRRLVQMLVDIPA